MKKEIKKIEPIDLTEILKGKDNKWIVISEDYKEIIKVGDSVNDLLEVKDKGIIMYVPNSNCTLSPTTFDGI
jgi:hypothetical protein